MFNNEYLRCFSSRMSGNLTYHYGHDWFDGGEGEVEAGERFCIIGEGFNGGKISYKDSSEAKALAASRNHSEAERRRRERINTHLSTLRRLIPSRDKMDKATLLGEVIHHVKELKKRFAEVAKGDSIPTDFDDLKVESHGGDGKGRNLIRVSICCDDRPDLLADLHQSFNEQRLKTVKAEMSCLGGRVRNVFLVTSQEEVNGSNEETQCFNSVKEALREVLNRPASTYCNGHGHLLYVHMVGALDGLDGLVLRMVRFAEVAKGDSIPTDVDDLKVESHGGDEKGRNFIRVSICCDDRPDLLADLLQSFNDQRLKTVKAEMSCLGGIARNVFLVTSQEEVNGSNEETVCFNSVKEALREVLNRPASSELTLRSSVLNK